MPKFVRGKIFLALFWGVLYIGLFKAKYLYMNECTRFWVLWFIILNNLAWLVWVAYTFYDFRVITIP